MKLPLRLYRHLVREETETQILLVLAGQAVRLLLGLASSALLARALGPAGLSTFSVLGAAMMIAITVSDFGLSNSAVRYLAAAIVSTPAQVESKVRAFARLRLVGALVVVGGALLLASRLATLLRLPDENGLGLVGLAALGVLATSTSSVAATLLRAQSRFPQLMATQTVNVALTVALMGALFLLGRLTIASALVVGAATAFTAALLGWSLLPAGWRQALRLRAPLASQEARRLWRFGRWLGVSAILATILAQLDLLLLNHWSTPQRTGQYALALNLALKAEMINQTLFVVLLPHVSGLAGRRRLVAYARRALGRSSLLAGLLLLALPLARPFITTVYGVAYAPAVPLFYLLLAVTIFDLLANPLLLLAYPLDMPRHIAGAHAIRVVLMLLGGLVLVPTWGGTGAAVAKLLAKVLGALFLGTFLAARLRREPAAQTL